MGDSPQGELKKMDVSLRAGGQESRTEQGGDDRRTST